MCRAIRVNDEMVCAACRLRWDVADPEPPQCQEGISATPPQERFDVGEELRKLRLSLESKADGPKNRKGT